MKFIAEFRRPASRALIVAAGRKSEYDPCEDRCGYRFVVGVCLWFWALGWKSEWRAEQ